MPRPSAQSRSEVPPEVGRQRQEGLQDGIAIDPGTGWQPVMRQRGPKRRRAVALQHVGKGSLRIALPVDKQGHRPEDLPFRVRRTVADQLERLLRLGAKAEIEQAPDSLPDRLGLGGVKFAVQPRPRFGEKLFGRYGPTPGWQIEQGRIRTTLCRQGPAVEAISHHDARNLADADGRPGQRGVIGLSLFLRLSGQFHVDNALGGPPGDLL